MDLIEISNIVAAAGIKHTMNKMKNGKATRNENIAYELLNRLGSLGVEKLTGIMNHVYNPGADPEEMLGSIFIALRKKSGTIECKNCRTIDLMIRVTTIILRAEWDRVKCIIRGKLSDKQFGYQTGNGARNAALCLKTLLESV